MSEITAQEAQPLLPEWTFNDFLGSEPYEYLYSHKDNKFLLQQMLAKVQIVAKQQHFPGFLKMWNAYVDSMSPRVSVAGDYVMMFPDMDKLFPGNENLEYKCGKYICDEFGVGYTNRYGEIVEVCSHPILPTKRIVDIDTREEKLEISFRRSDHWRSIIVGREILASAQKIVQIARHGIAVNSENAKDLVKYITDVESMNYDSIPVAKSASRMGWVDGLRFLPYEDGLVFDGDSRFGEMFRSLTEHGDRGKWFSVAREVRNSTSIEARVMLATSFASVLAKPLGTLPFIVHCWSDVSGTGKTVALMLAASVWADPNEGAYVRNMNTTNAAVEIVAGFLNSLPMCFDELCTRDRRDGAETLVYMVCESAGRSRASRNGGIQTQQKWKNCAITTGETPILTENSRAGAENRVIDLEVSGPLFSDPISTANVIRQNYGFAGRMLIEALQADGGISEVKGYYDEYLPKLQDTGATTKQAMPMALILAADRFCAEHVFNDDRYLTIRDVSAMLKSNEQVDTNLRAYEWLMGMIAENNHRFEPVDEHYSGPIWGKMDDRGPDNVVVCIIRSRFNTLLTEEGFNARSFLKWARRMDVIETSNAGEPTKQVRISGMGNTNTRCVCLKMNALKSHGTQQFQQVEVSEDDLPF